MKKEEILEMSRKENKNKDLASIEVGNKASKMGLLSILILSTVYFILEIVICGETNYGWYSIIALYSGIVYAYKAVKESKISFMVCGAIWLLLAICFVIVYVRGIFANAI